MDLKALITKLQNQRLNDSDAALKNIANSEKYLQQSYEGRYLFELIQNVRDTNKEQGKFGSVFIELSNGFLIVSNTGAPFTERGINSITTIGDSPKDSQEFIGFKGIGFKSVHEVSDMPKIVTEWGSVVFDRQKTKELLGDRVLQDHDVPLFFIPHYDDHSLSDHDRLTGIVTKVVLQLKSLISSEVIERRFNEVGIHQILLLGSIKHIELINGETRYKYVIEQEKSGKVIITKNDKSYSFKHFKPSTKISIPKSIIDTLEDKEREIYEKDPFVDISLLFDLDENSRLRKNGQSKLFLFYPTEITSGFNFIIHSYFLVSPDRKSLRDSVLNRHILECIADFITGQWLSQVKKSYSGTYLDFLVFTRNNDAAILTHLYDRLISQLKNQKFIFDRNTKHYYAAHEIIVADGFDKGLFPDNQLNGKPLIYVENTVTRDWLTKEFDIEYLSFETIAENIERECVRQRDRKNFKFFENLYRYLVEYDDLNLKGRRVLLTSNLELLCSEDYVFYGLKEKIQFPRSIDKRINFIHPEIKISDQRQGKGQTGFVEYNTDLLVRRLLRLYDDPDVHPKDILISLFKLNISDRLFAEIRPKVILPVIGGEWINPIRKATYFESDELAQLYPLDSFIDMQVFAELQLSKADLISKLTQLGVWQIPGVFFSQGSVTIGRNDRRFQYINNYIRSFSTQFFIVNGEWKLDEPTHVTKWFTDSIISNWSTYNSKITEDNNLSISYRSQSSDSYAVVQAHWVSLSGVIKYLREGKWIKIDGENEPLNVNEVIGIDPIEARQASSSLFRKYLRLLEIHQAPNSTLIGLLYMNHLDGRNLINFKRILSHIHELYKAFVGPDKEFLSFYNKVLSKLFDFYFASTNKDTSMLNDCMWLGINEINQTFKWLPAKQLYYIDDKPAYDILPTDIKQIIQPHFTNRDKNRFGQIGRKIGLNFKLVIDQKIVNIKVAKELTIDKWLPAFSEGIALTEVLLETNLDAKIEELKVIRVIVCENFAIELYKDSQLTSIIADASHAIVNNELIEIYVRETAVSTNKMIYASVLHDVLVEVLGRDLHTVRLTLNDFYSRPSRKLFLTQYEVSLDRIEEIESRIKGISISKIQAFWFTILLLKGITEPQIFLVGTTVDFAKISLLLNAPCEILAENIDYGSINKIENLQHLQFLFSKLEIDVSLFNNISEIKIDFTNHFQNKLKGLRFEFKKTFEVLLHDYLEDKDITQKCSFQDEVDKYSETHDQLPSPILMFDYKRHFFSGISSSHGYLEIADVDLAEGKADLLKKYRENERRLKSRIKVISNDRQLLQEFIELNTNRSLLYFDDTINELEIRFRDWCKRNEGNDDGSIGENEILGKYLNPPGLTIQQPSIVSVEPYPSGGHSGGRGIGKRVDGGRNNSDAELSGMVGEKMVFEMLSKEYPTAEWISRNAANAGFNPEGSDVHSCDIKYVDENGQPQYVEVKSSLSDDKHFYVSFSEYNKAIQEQDCYHFYLVLYSLDNNRRQILNLKNIFILEEGQELFSNNHFTANFSNLEIRFQ